MSTTVASCDDDDRMKKKKRTTLAREQCAPVPSKNGHSEVQLPLFQAAVESEFVQKILELLTVLWAKVLELEQQILASFDRMAGKLDEIRPPVSVQDFYSTEEFARIRGVQVETIQDQLRRGKIEGFKTDVGGRGETGEWRIPHSERLRLGRDGLYHESPFRKKNPNRPTNKNLKQFRNKNLPK